MTGDTPEQLSVSYRALAEMISAGLPLNTILEHFVGVARSAVERRRLERILAAVRKGKGLADAMGATGRFARLDVTLIRVAEAAGRLTEVSHALANRYQLEAETLAELRAQLVKPALTLLIALAVAPAPGFAAGTVSAAGYLARFLLPLISLAATYSWFAAAHRRVRLTGEPGPLSYQVAAALPVLRGLGRSFDLERFCSCLAMCLKSGLPLPESVETAGGVVSNPVLRLAAHRVLERIGRGGGLADAFRAAPEFDPPYFSQLGAAELAGALPANLDRLAAHYRGAAMARMRWIAAWVPKIAYGCVALYMAYWIVSNYPMPDLSGFN